MSDFAVAVLASACGLGLGLGVKFAARFVYRKVTHAGGS